MNGIRWEDQPWWNGLSNNSNHHAVQGVIARLIRGDLIRVEPTTGDPSRIRIIPGPSRASRADL